MHEHHDARRTIPDDADTLRAVADTTGIPYDRLRQARLRNADAFPTHWYRGERLHRPTEVADWMSKTSRGRPRIHTTSS